MPSGYSSTPLPRKLGIRPDSRICILNAPRGYLKTLGSLPERVVRVRQLEPELDFVHFFTKEAAALNLTFGELRDAIHPAGMVWISWPKRSSGLKSDLDESVVREIGLMHGMVDVKVCAVDAVWNGLKFVFRVKDRRS